MEGYVSEQEQVEALKRWWKANGKSVILGVVIGVAIVGGGRWWLANQKTQAELASEQYEQVLLEVQKGDSAAAVEQGGRLLQNNTKSNYAALTALELAKLKVGQSDLEGARFYLQWIMDHSSVAPLKDVARLRLAQVLLAKGDKAGALQSVEAVADMKAFVVPAQELKGDIFMAMGRANDARTAYDAALAANSSGVDQSRLQMKLAEAGGKGAS